MFLDLRPDGGGGNAAVCPSCKRPIWPGEDAHLIHFAHDDPDGLDSLNGLYHRACAQPYASVIRAINALRNIPR